MSLGCGTKTTGCCSRSPAGLFVVVVVVVGCWLVASAPVSAVAPLRRNGGGGTVAGPRHEPHPPRVSAWNRLPLVQSAFQSKSSLLQPVGKSVGRRFRHHHRQQQQQQQRSLRILLSLSVSSTLSPVVRQLRGGGVGASSSRSWVGAPIPSAATTTTSRLASLPSSNSNSIMAADDDTNSNSDSFSIGSSNTVAPFNVSLWDAGSTSMDDVYRTLNTTAASGGLTRAEAAVRAVYYGPNALDAAPSRSLLSLILDQFRDRLVQILVGVAVLSALFSWAEASSSLASIGSHHLHTDGNNNNAAAMWKSFVEPMVIVAILILNAGVGVWQSQSASDSLKALEDLQAAECTVLRNHNNDTDTGEQQQQQDTQGGGNIVPASILVPGDIVALRPGDKVPADGRLVSLTSSVLAVDEGSLTGESVTVFKLPGDEGRASAIDSPIPDQRGMLYAGTVVTQGTGTMVVTQTGMDTQFGRIQRGVLQAEPPKTPLQSKLDDFGSTLTVIIGAICLAVWIVSIPKMNDPSFSSVWDGAVYYAKVAVALGVAAIPEGLPAVITLCLSLGTRRMAQRNVIVRNLPSVETLGCTSVICTDKTGTLTTNEMTVVSLIVMEHTKKGDATVEEHMVEGFSYSPMGVISGIPYNDEVKDQPIGAIADIAAVSALCNDARIIGNDDKAGEVEEDTVDSDGTAGVSHTTSISPARKSKVKNGDTKERKTYERVGEPTEAALCVLAEKLGGMSHYLDGGHLDRNGLHFNVPPSVLASANVNAWRKFTPRLATLEFSRDRKSMSVLCNIPKGSYPTESGFHKGVRPRKAGNRLFVKGAPNLLIERCTHVKFRDGTVAKMTAPLRRDIEMKVAELANRPLRCLALAVKDTNNLEDSLRRFAPGHDREVSRHPLLADASNYRNIESGLTLVGVVGIKDPARPGVAESIRLCAKAGIRVMMITGDAKATAIAIARDVNIFPSEEASNGKEVKAYEGREFFLKSNHEQLEILKEDNIVFCRAEPSDKQKLIKMLQSLNEVTCMTGDGVNDAPALQQASIGVAMGITGTEVSKEASDMILADDNFSTIVSAVEEGRRIYNNMQAFICFLISCNIGEICAIVFATLAGFPEPLTAMHLLWVNLVTDGPPATALGFNPPAPDLMEVPPRPSNEPIMTRWLLIRYCITGLYVGLATIGVFAQHYLRQGITLAQLGTWSQCGEFWIPLEGAGLCSDLFQGSGRMLPQTLALTTLVCMEMMKALSAVSVDSSLLRVGPQDNKWLLLGVTGPIVLHLGVVYSSHLGFPALGESFGMVPMTRENWVTVLCWAAPILLVDEVLKAIGRWINREERMEKSLATGP